MLSKEQIGNLAGLADKAMPGPFGRNETSEAEFSAAATPQAVRELIAMLEAAQKDAALYKFQRKQVLRKQKWLSESEYDECLSVAMQRDCDGANHAEPARPKPLTANDLEKGKLYYIRGNGMCEYVGLDHYMGETTCQFRRVEHSQHPRDFYYTRIDKIPTTVFVKKEDSEQ